MENSLIRLHGDGVARIFPGGIVVFNFDNDDDGTLSQILSSKPGMPVVFLSTEFNRNVFSQAEGRNRAFIFSRNAIDPASVDPEYPVQWVSDGDYLPRPSRQLERHGHRRRLSACTPPPPPRPAPPRRPPPRPRAGAFLQSANYLLYLRYDMDKNTLEFVTYCISKLSALLNLPQREVYDRLKRSGILYDYIVPSYDVLHTFGYRYLMEDLTDYMREKGVL